MFQLTDNNCAEVPAQLLQDLAEVLGAENLAADQEEDADRGKVDDPGGYGHHRVREGGEEVQQGLPLLPQLCQGHAQHNGEHDQAENVGAVCPLA